MRLLQDQDYQTRLPEGFLAIPLNLAEASASLGLRVIVRQADDPAWGRFILLRQTNLARVYLGCLADAGGAIVDWVEIWVQRADPEGFLLGSKAGPLTNPLLDALWAEQAARFRAVDDATIGSPLETMHPALVYLDLAAGRSSDCLAAGWKLPVKQDDAALQAANLPGFGQSLARYGVWQQGDETKAVPLTPGAPENERTAALSSLLPENAVIFNPTCGLLLLRRFFPATLEEISDLLGGAPWRGIEASKNAFLPSGIYQSLQDADFLRHGDGLFFGAAAGRLGRVPECAALRLEMLRQALVSVARATQKSQLPLLNVTADSFRLKLTAQSPGLPALWTSSVSLVALGEAHALDVPNSTGRYFQPNHPLPHSVYRPELLTIPLRGTASLRIREVFPESRDGSVVEATFSTQERPTLARNDLVKIQIPMGEGQIYLYGKLEAVDGMVRGEAIFRSLPEHFAPPTVEALAALKGVARNQLAYEIICPLSAPTDLFSLAVLAIRLLLVNPRRALPAAVDAVMSLGRELKNQADQTASPASRVQAILESHAGWLENLGPQNLLDESFPAADVLAHFPIALWAEVLAFVVQLVPGLCAQSFRKDLGDADNLALHTIYDEPEKSLARLCLRVRRLVFAEWRETAELAQVIQHLREQY